MNYLNNQVEYSQNANSLNSSSKYSLLLTYSMKVMQVFQIILVITCIFHASNASISEHLLALFELFELFKLFELFVSMRFNWHYLPIITLCEYSTRKYSTRKYSKHFFLIFGVQCTPILVNSLACLRAIYSIGVVVR